MKRILLLLLLPLLTVVWVQAASDYIEVEIDGVTYRRYKDSGSKWSVSAIDYSRDTIRIITYIKYTSGRNDYSASCAGFHEGVFENHKNLRVLYYYRWRNRAINGWEEPPSFKGCTNLEIILPTTNDNNNYKFYSRGDSALYCSDGGLFAFPPKPRNFFKTDSKLKSKSFAHCNIRTLMIDGQENIASDAFFDFKGKIVFTKPRSGYGCLCGLNAASSVDVVSWNEYDLARKSFGGKITVNGGNTLRIVPEDSTLTSLAFRLEVYGNTQLSDVRTVTVNGKPLTISSDGKYFLDNLLPAVNY